MRRGLSEVRTMLTEQDELRPFNMNEQLCNGMPVWKFVYLVATGLHKKRSKNRRVEKKLSDDQDK